MKKILLSLLAISLLALSSFSQDIKKQAKAEETKMDVFASKTGTIIKFVDYSLPNVKLSYGDLAELRIRVMYAGNEPHYFYQIEHKGQYSTDVASIEYSDLLEVIKAIQTLKVDISKDIALNPDYLENKFTTVDGFQVGYFVNKGKASWYLKLEKYGSNSTIFLKDSESVEQQFNDAKTRIEQLKK